MKTLLGGETLNRCLQLEFEAGRLNGIVEVGHRNSLPSRNGTLQHLFDTLIPQDAVVKSLLATSSTTTSGYQVRAKTPLGER